jgi:formylglycine-generating enzyme required for sulfatase activity
MPGMIFINYRRGDERAMAARIRDRLATTFGDANVFMDVDNLMAGQRFDKELEKALAETDVFLAVIGPRWLELLAERQGSDEKDYVHEEIAAALQRGIVVIPVLIEQTPMPHGGSLPADVRDLVLHQKHVVTHEQFGRDVAGLVEAIRFARKPARPEAGAGTVRWAAILSVLLLGVSTWWIATHGTSESGPASSTADAERKRAEEAERLAAQKAEQDRIKADQDRKIEEKKRRAEAELRRPGREFRDCADVCPVMVVLPAGAFTMGSPPGELGRTDDEGPQRKMTIARPFAVGKFEVTFAEWDACVADRDCTHRPSDQGWGRGRRPVINVSWPDAKEYVAWLSRKTSKSYRLLSEAEWEYSARAGTTTRYAFGDAISTSQAQFLASKTVEVGSFPANKFGLHDLHGNVWEWVEDALHPSYQGAPGDGSVWAGGDVSLRVLRGGAWGNLDPVGVRSALRGRSQPGLRRKDFGFRVARTL